MVWPDPDLIFKKWSGPRTKIILKINFSSKVIDQLYWLSCRKKKQAYIIRSKLKVGSGTGSGWFSRVGSVYSFSAGRIRFFMEVGSEGWVKSTLIRNPNNSYSMVGSLDLYQSCGQDQDSLSGSLSELLRGSKILKILTLIITWGRGANMTRLFLFV